MKKLKPVLLSLSIIGLISFNIVRKSNDRTATTAHLLNLKSLQASASEARCAPTSQNSCIVDFNGVSIYGYGQPVIIW